MTINLHSFAKLESALQKNESGYIGQIPDAWRQGRTAYGGLTAGLSLAAVQAQFPDAPPMRSANINFIGPVTENPTFKNTILRKGKNVTSIESKAIIGTQVVANIVFILAANRVSDINVKFPTEDQLSPDDCTDFMPKEINSLFPSFLSNFDVKLISGNRPITSAKQGYIRTWARHKDPASRNSMTSLLTISDVLPPAAMPLLTKMGPVSSVNFMLNILDDNPQTDEGWWDIETKLTAAKDGYSSQIMRIWNRRGNLVAEGLQCVAIFN